MNLDVSKVKFSHSLLRVCAHNLKNHLKNLVFASQLITIVVIEKSNLKEDQTPKNGCLKSVLLIQST
jgi:hypothetical protein